MPTIVSRVPCRTKKSGAAGVMRSSGEALSNASGSLENLFLNTRGARKRSRIWRALFRPLAPATSYTP